MTITLFQGLLIALFAFISGIDLWLEGFYWFRPMIVCTVTGIILGDVTLGVVAAGLTELTFAGLTAVGGTQPPNPVLAGIMTVVIAKTTGHSAETAIGLSLPFSILMQYIVLFYYSAFSAFTKRMDNYASNADFKKFTRLAVLLTVLVGLTFALVSFLSVYGAQGAMKALVNSFPDWLTHGFTIAGGILPAVGFGLLLKNMFKVRYLSYLLIGFAAACFITFGNLMPVAVIGVALALMEFYTARKDFEHEKKMNELKTLALSGGGEEDGI
ncbi:MAG: PTS N-acetylgalactosamine transporter subunit IIC [Streptococcaceae bacterium]|jgi:PTS system galactosamine-specific IIC component|nr:PTS N-acetylgalactosamine transporter subunit IIC [Streptococcaceae bacterium]